MNLTELSALFPPSCSLANNMLLVAPSDFKKLVGYEINGIHVFMMVSSGSLTLLINGKEYEMQSCTLLDILDWNTIQIIDTSPNLKAYCLFPNQKFTGESLNSLKPGPEDYFQERIYNPIFPLSGKEHNTIENELQSILASLHDINNHYRQELVRTHFKSLILELGNIVFTHYEGSPQVPNLSKRDRIIMGFLKLLWKYFRTEHNIDFYADKLGISSKHLSRVTKEMLGKTAYDVISNEIMQEAVSQLKNPDTSIQEISMNLHFSEQAAFCKFFKKQMHISPSEYRKQYQ